MDFERQSSHETTIKRLTSILSSRVRFASPQTWSSWNTYAAALVGQGGLVEVSSQKREGDVFKPILHLMVYPSGKSSLLGTSCMLVGEQGDEWGTMIPCKTDLATACLIHRQQIEKTAVAQGMLGYISCEFEVWQTLVRRRSINQNM